MLNRQALLSTMPKSGTWYLICFLWSYNKALKNTEVDLKKELWNALKTKELAANPTMDALNIAVIYTGHWEAPGYREMKDKDPYYSEWDKLAYYVPMYDFGSTVAEKFNPVAEKFNPQKDPDAKIIYIYRNPLDQLVSMYRHTLNHVLPGYRQMIKAGEYVDFKNLQEFVFEASGIKSYIKQYHSFKVAKNHYPNNFLLISYEELILNPEKFLKEMLLFLGHVVRTTHEREAFRIALDVTKIDSMKKIESQLGWTLGQDQTDKNESHIRSGQIGDWKQSLSNNDVKRIDHELERFGYSLKDFITHEKKLKNPNFLSKEVEQFEYELKQWEYELKQWEDFIKEFTIRRGVLLLLKRLIKKCYLLTKWLTPHFLKRLIKKCYLLTKKSLAYIDSRVKL